MKPYKMMKFSWGKENIQFGQFSLSPENNVIFYIEQMLKRFCAYLQVIHYVLLIKKLVLGFVWKRKKTVLHLQDGPEHFLSADAYSGLRFHCTTPLESSA